MNATVPPAVELVPVPQAGRRFVTTSNVHLGDVDPRGRLRLDAIARLLQNVASDDVADSGLDGAATAWVVRRTLIDVRQAPHLGERLTLTTFCSATGRAWAERRTSIGGASGGHAEAVSLWIYVNAATGRPAALTSAFHEIYGSSTGGRQVSPRLQLDGPPATASARPWVVRAVDLDVLRHVNNASQWPIVEELVVDLADRTGVGELEFLRPVDRGGDVQLHLSGGTGAWLVVDGAVHSAARWSPRTAEPLPA